MAFMFTRLHALSHVSIAVLAASLLGGAPSLALAQAQTSPQPAPAGEAAPAEDTDTIIVTARKSSERLVDVPISITALGQAEIAAAGLESVADVAMQTPGFSYRQGFGRQGGGQAGATSRPSIRGMSSIVGGANAAFFVDGIFVSGNISSYQLDNLERVEVIRGPQSALFGRQTFGGAVNFVTRQPGEELAGRITATAGKWGHNEISGYMSAPLIPGKLYAELNARSYEFGGDYDNAATKQRDIGAQSSFGLGGKIVFNASDRLSFRLDASYAKDEDGPYPYTYFGSTKNNCFLPVIGGTFLGIPRSTTRSRGYYCGEITVQPVQSNNINQIRTLGYDSVQREALRASLTGQYETESGYQFTAVAAWNSSENVSGIDNTLTPSATPSLAIGGSTTADKSLELRVLSPRDASFRWLAGVYAYSEADGDGFDAGGTYNPAGNSNQKRLLRSGDGVENRAVFAMVEWDVTERLTLTAEGRYQQDEITDADSPLGAPFSDVRPDPINSKTVSYEAFLPRITGRYEINERTNLYGSIAHGNKPGGFNSLPARSTFFDGTLYDDYVKRFQTFNEEDVWSYELGLKGSLWGRKLNYNTAIYFLDWQKQQLTESQPYTTAASGGRTADVITFTVNAGASEVKGFEAELFGALTNWFDYRLGYSYNDGKFTDFYDINVEELRDTDGLLSTDPADKDGRNGQVAGNRIPQTPVHELNASATVTLPVGGSGLEWFARADYNYESKRYVQADNLAWVGDSHMLNLKTGLTTGAWNLTVYANNALDDDTPAVATRLLDFSRSLLVPEKGRNFSTLQNHRLTFYRDFTVSAARKPEAGVTLSYRF
jgi:iron complex outermembrane recepter protein